ncbi:hypothetical protein [Actinophytocola sp.]|uniref:hypothetical protein n=1 Tax=Actinophytocola sp. TaxID=1872138 RepID=UPI002D80280F|nr:hypothetical protein [Actinophytocola sp.]HET9139258.1 hypothetical protein [Actinophytocola sp.]
MAQRWIPLQPGAKVIGLRWGYSPEKYQSKSFWTPEEAADYAGGNSFVEVVALRNPAGGPTITFEGRFLQDPSAALRPGAVVERVWYTLPRMDTVYDGFDAAYEIVGEGRNAYIQEHLRLKQSDDQVIEQQGRVLNLDPSRSVASGRCVNAYR